MNIPYCVPFFVFHFVLISSQTLNNEDSTTESNEQSSSENITLPSTNAVSEPIKYLQDIEIIKIYMTSPNSLKMFWGTTPEEVRLNTTYGLFYNIDSPLDLTDPKTKTQEPCIEVLNLEHCKKYFFAVAKINDGKGINPNSSNIRSIVTYMDPIAPPLSIHVDFVPGKIPCLQIKWTASCQNIHDAQGYKIRLIENSRPTPTTNILRTLLSTKFEQACTIPVYYGSIYEISIANDNPRAAFSKIVKVKIPHFIQPYDVKLAVNESNGAFLLYWREPYVPVCNGHYFYEVLVFNEKQITPKSNHTIFRVNRPGFVYKGNQTEYTFGVDLVCCDYSERSPLSELVHADVFGKVEYIDSF